MVALPQGNRLSGRAMIERFTARGHVVALHPYEVLQAYFTLVFGLGFASVIPVSFIAGGLLETVAQLGGRNLWALIAFGLAVPQIAGILLAWLGVRMPRHHLRIALLYASTGWWTCIATIFVLTGSTAGGLVYGAIALATAVARRHVALYNGGTRR